MIRLSLARVSVVCVLAALALALPGPSAAPSAAAPRFEGPNFATLGQGFLKDRDVKNVADLPPDQLLAKHYVRGALGLIDVAFPVSITGDKPRVEDFQKQCLVLVALQRVWLEWLAGADPRAEPGKKALADLTTWVQSWKATAIAKADKAADKDLYALCGATDAVKQAQTQVVACLTNVELVGIAPRDGKRLSLVFAPTRRDFVELLGYAGLADPAQQGLLWAESSTQWTNFWIGWNFVVAMEYPSWGNDPEFRTGTSMSKFDATGLQQHTLLNAANALQWLCYGDDDALYLHQGVAMNLAIAVVGELNTLEGDTVRGTTGGSTRPYEKFVPGGNPNGGILPPIPATSQDALKDGRWRDGKAKDHCAGVLRKNQKEGAKQLVKDRPKEMDVVLERDKSAHFLLIAGENGPRTFVSAPFFGEQVAKKPYPKFEFLPDYREFFRAYKCCFLDWLRKSGDKTSPEASETKFRELLKKLNGRAPDVTYEAVVQQIYGLPLSAANGSSDSLEWRFLDWLAKGR